ncbi:MAG TPA: bifunctional ornithine acetyltransferase/N-acetylglutamate synthase [Alphaproteobacteria bacterium]|nr:bifunctional ornithine acetyltransferase/N-acetylglutamate synthase [Alphaproteobacteria bacterium]
MASKFPLSPLAPAAFPVMPEVAGARMAVFASGMRYQGRDDLLLMAFDKGTSVAGMFTTSKAPSAPVDWCRRHLPQGFGTARAVLVNAGNANAFTGRQGDRAARQCAETAAKCLGCPKGQVLLGSTGVIGVPLEAEKITASLAEMAAGLHADGWSGAAEAIRTTDTFPKGATACAMIDGAAVRINGIAKGSGMIAPDMATMLAYVVTDAKIPPAILHALLKQAVNQSFNMISVDGDTSTSDTVLLFATGKARHRPITRAGDPRLRDFRARLNEVMRDLAHQVVRDGEGARKFISIKITGAASPRAARRIAMSVANSPLVKTAIAGEDANWGRIVMAIGKAGEAADRDALRIRIGGILVAQKGAIDPDYREEKLTAYMKGDEISIEADIGVGKAESEVWTCDLTHGYIDINADYRS